MKKLIVGALVALFASAALAWPTKEITIIVPFSPGGIGDTHSRVTAIDLEKMFNVPVVVKNMPGGAMAVAMNHILATENDNHTFMWSMDDVVVTPIVQNTRNYEKFAGVNIVGTYPAVIFGGPDSSLDKFKQQVSNGSTVNVGNLGYNGHYHLWTTNIQSKLKVNPVPYKGQAQMIPDVISGNLEYGISNLSAFLSLVKDGKLKPIMISTATRQHYLPDVPTFRELGFKGDAMTGWLGYTARRDTDPEAIAKFGAAVRTITVNNTKVQELGQRGINLVNLGPADADKFLADEVRRVNRFKITQE